MPKNKKKTTKEFQKACEQVNRSKQRKEMENINKSKESKNERKKEVCIMEMDIEWKPKENDIDLSNKFHFSVRTATQEAKAGNINIPLFYFKSKRLDRYYRLEIQSSGEIPKKNKIDETNTHEKK